MRCGGRNSARRGGSAAQYRKRGIPSVLLVGAAEHRTARRLRRSKIAELHDSLAAQCQSSRFPAKRDIRHAGHPPNPRKRRGFAAGKRTSDTSLIIIHQKKDVCQYRRRRIFPFAEYGDVFRPRKRGRGGGGRHPRQRSAYRNERKRAAADMPHRGVEKMYAPNAPSCAKIRFPYHKHRTQRIGGTKFCPRKRGYNICEQPRFSR